MNKMKIFPMTTLALACSGIGATYAAELEEIVVTAQKREQALSEVPIAIQAFTGADLESKGVQSLDDLINVVPGAATLSTGTPNNPIFAIRGVGTAVIGDSSTAYYVDELPYSVLAQNIAPPVNFFDLERVEVLRGPQGTLYGLGSLGGAVRFITKDADASGNLSGKVRAWGSDVDGGEGNFGGDLAVNIPLIEDVLAARVSASFNEEGGFAEDAFGNDDVNTTEFLNIRTSVKWTPSDELEVKFGYWRNDVDNEFLNFLGDADNQISAFLPGTFFDTEFDIFNTSISYDLGFATITNALSYLEREELGDFPFGIAAQDSGSDQETWSNEFRIASNGDGPFHWVTGVYFNNSDQDRFTNTSAVALPVGTPGVPDGQDFIDARSEGNRESTAWAIFGEVSYDFLDGKLTPLFGLRYFEDDREFEDDAQVDEIDDGVFVDGSGDALDSELNDVFEALSPRFNLTYRPDENGLVYLNIARGFRSGNFQDFASAAPLLQLGLPANQVVTPDQIWSYEVGSKYTLLDGRLTADVALYYTNWENRMTSLAAGANSGILVNGGDAEIYGFEWAFTYLTPIEGLTLQFVGNVNESEISDQEDEFVNAGALILAEGEELAGFPAFSVTLVADYQTSISDGLLLNLNGSYTHRDDQLDQDNPNFVTEDLDMLNLRAGISAEDGTWGVTLFVKNALNEDDVDTSFNQGIFLTVPDPREVGLELTYSFGE